jgi:hypothetical protein
MRFRKQGGIGCGRLCGDDCEKDRSGDQTRRCTTVLRASKKFVHKSSRHPDAALLNFFNWFGQAALAQKSHSKSQNHGFCYLNPRISELFVCHYHIFSDSLVYGLVGKGLQGANPSVCPSLQKPLKICRLLEVGCIGQQAGGSGSGSRHLKLAKKFVLQDLTQNDANCPEIRLWEVA